MSLTEKTEKRATLKSIAEALNISKTTVSLVLKGDGDRYRISKATQKKILNYADSVGFVPDFLAKALVTQKTSTIGLILPDVHESFMSEMVKGIESVIYKAGYSLILSTSGFDTDVEMKNIRQMLYKKTDGIIIVPYIPIAVKDYSHGYLETIKKSDCPFVFADRVPPKNSTLNWIVQDDYTAAAKAVQLLFKKGCRNIACLSFDLHASSIDARIRGYHDGMKECGLYMDNDSIILIDKQDSDSNDLYLKIKECSESDKPFDGIFVTTGGLAHKLRYLVKNTDIQAPGLRIVKFGKDPEYFTTGMSQIIQPNVEMGMKAAQTILELIKNPETPPVQIEVKSQIIEEDD